MKNIILILSFFGLLNMQYPLVNAQNLVPNPSFEDTVNCPVFGDIFDAMFWTNPTSYSPDYYNSCVISSGSGDGFSVPNNWYGLQTARTGNAYAGIILHIATDGREYIQSQLIDSLQSGKKYYVSFYVSLADSCAYANNNVGAYFSVAPVSSASSLSLPYSPQISNNTVVNPLNIPNTWIHIHDTIVANGGEKYIVIGNFNDDSSSDTTHLNNGVIGASFSYYYLDDISVTLTDTTTSITDYYEEAEISVFPNPSTGIFVIRKNQLSFSYSIIDSFGQELAHGFIEKDNRIDLSSWPNGIYYLLVNNKTNYYKPLKLVLTKT